MSIKLILFVLGVILININLLQKKNCESVIESKFIPRTFEEKQLNPERPSKIYSTMFNSDNIWAKYPF